MKINKGINFIHVLFSEKGLFLLKFNIHAQKALKILIAILKPQKPI